MQVYVVKVPIESIATWSIKARSSDDALDKIKKLYADAESNENEPTLENEEHVGIGGKIEVAIQEVNPALDEIYASSREIGAPTLHIVEALQ